MTATKKLGPVKQSRQDNETLLLGDAVNLSALIEETQGLVRSIAVKIHRNLPFPVDLDDLIAYGQLGLIEAAQAFDSAVGVQFTTFAYYRIRGAIYDGISKMTWTSRARLRRMRFLQMANSVLESEQSSPDCTNSAIEDVQWLGRVSERLAVVFLATGGDDEESQHGLADAISTEQSPAAALASRELQQELRKHVQQLPADACRLVTSIYFDGYTLTEAAERAGMSKSWASRLHAKSLDQLARKLR